MMFGMAFGVAMKFFAQKALGNAVKDIKGVGSWIGSLDVVHLALLVAVILLAVDHVALLISHRSERKETLALSHSTLALEHTRTALQKSLKNEGALRVQLGRQNSGVKALGAQSDKQQQSSLREQAKAKPMADAAKAAAASLKASSELAPKADAPCELSPEVKSRWHG